MLMPIFKAFHWATTKLQGPESQYYSVNTMANYWPQLGRALAPRTPDYEVLLYLHWRGTKKIPQMAL